MFLVIIVIELFLFVPFEFVFIEVIKVLVFVLFIIGFIRFLLPLVTEVKEWNIIRLIINVLLLLLPWSLLILLSASAFLRFSLAIFSGWSFVFSLGFFLEDIHFLPRLVSRLVWLGLWDILEVLAGAALLFKLLQFLLIVVFALFVASIVFVAIVVVVVFAVLLVVSVVLFVVIIIIIVIVSPFIIKFASVVKGLLLVLEASFVVLVPLLASLRVIVVPGILWVVVLAFSLVTRRSFGFFLVMWLVALVFIVLIDDDTRAILIDLSAIVFLVLILLIVLILLAVVVVRRLAVVSILVLVIVVGLVVILGLVATLVVRFILGVRLVPLVVYLEVRRWVETAGVHIHVFKALLWLERLVVRLVELLRLAVVMWSLPLPLHGVPLFVPGQVI